MKCRCGAEQCYLCRQPVEGYSHFCECGWKEKSGNCPNCFKVCPLWGDPEERDRVQMDEITAAFNTVMKDDTDVTSTESVNLYVKNFGEELNDGQLYDLFKMYGTIVSHAVMKNPDGKSKGFGFVAFDSSQAAESAINGLHGYALPISKKKLYVAEAKKRDKREVELKESVNVYITNLRAHITEEDLQRYFENCGKIISVKILFDANNQSRGCGFVRFADREVAEKAIKDLNGRTLDISKKLHIVKDEKRSGRPANANQIKEDRNLYIKNLDTSLDDNDLKAAFQKFGKITSTTVCFIFKKLII